MSFILDALRKSEHERQRGAVPGISHVPLAVSHREVPRWMIGVIGALCVAVIGLGAAWWLSTRQAGDVRAADAAVPRSVPLDVPTRASGPALRAPEPAARAPRVAAPPQDSAGATSPVATAAAAPPLRTSDEHSIETRFEPARPTPTSAEPTLPSAASLAAEGIAVPPLRLELHGFSETPADRFVFINGTRYREGETLREGPRLLSIDRNGAVLSQQGRRFLLAPQ